MSRNIIFALIGSLLLHGGFALSGHFFKPEEEVAKAKEETPTIELAPMPPIEPDKPETVETNDDTPPPETAEIPPPSIADTPSVSMDSPFEQQIQPPPANVNRPTGTISIPTGRPGGAGGGSKNVFDLASLDQKPVQTFQAKANHPFELLRARISGAATVKFIVDASGNVRDAEVISATHREFGPEAVKAIMKWKFRPGKKSGSAVSTRMEVTYKFSLGQSSS
jgi:protein TonB